jgi:hypothetical protein
LKTPWKKPVEYSWSLHSAGHIGALSCYSEIRFSSFLAWSPCPKISAEMGPWSSTAWLFSLFSYEYENLPRMIITMGKGNPFFPQKKEWPAHGAGSLTHLALVLAGLLSHPLRSPRQILLSVASVVTCWNPRLAICWGKERRLERKENSDHQTWIPHLSEFPEKKTKKEWRFDVLPVEIPPVSTLQLLYLTLLGCYNRSNLKEKPSISNSIHVQRIYFSVPLDFSSFFSVHFFSVKAPVPHTYLHV